jgi:hypothetical protein
MDTDKGSAFIVHEWVVHVAPLYFFANTLEHCEGFFLCAEFDLQPHNKFPSQRGLVPIPL